jgi:hypothetical protein
VFFLKKIRPDGAKLYSFSVTFVRPDRDVAITPRSMGTSSGTKARAAQAAFDSFCPLLVTFWGQKEVFYYFLL